MSIGSARPGMRKMRAADRAGRPLQRDELARTPGAAHGGESRCHRRFLLHLDT